MKPYRILAVLTLAVSCEAGTNQLQLDVSPIDAVLKSGEKQNTWIRVGLKGYRLESDKKRPGVNLALVLDKSGSMQGEKITRAREAAIDAINQLDSNDIVSIITYDSTVNVLVPATKLSDKQQVIQKIKSIQPGGNTALFAGISKGAAEVRKFLDKERVNRVILLSDGLANVGPSSPGELGDLGKSLVKENISVSTLGLGLGYNEDLMVNLASNSGGNHLFIEKASELTDIFRREFDDVLSVVAQEIDVNVQIPDGIRPVRVLGSDADITGQKIVTRLSQIYSEQDRHFIVELEVPATNADRKHDLASVKVSYANMKTHESDKLSGATKVKFSDDEDVIKKSRNTDVLGDVVALVSSERSKLATRYLDAGDLIRCREELQGNVDFLQLNSFACPDGKTRDKLQVLAVQNRWQMSQLNKVKSNKDDNGKLIRKSFRSYQSEVDNQQRAKSNKPD